MADQISVREARRLLEREVERWMLWGYDDWIDMCETDPEDDDSDLFFYLTEFEDDAYSVEVFFGPSDEGVVSVELIVTLGGEEREAYAAWEIGIDGRVEMLEKEVDPEDAA